MQWLLGVASFVHDNLSLIPIIIFGPGDQTVLIAIYSMFYLIKEACMQ